MSNAVNPQKYSKDKNAELRNIKPSINSDKNANSTINTSSGTIRKLDSKSTSLTHNDQSSINQLNTCSARTLSSQPQLNLCNATLRDCNYMELPHPTNMSQFKELFCDFPVSYESTAVITAAQFTKNTLVLKPPPQPPPPFREPSPPTPPPLSQLPSRDPKILTADAITTPNSAPNTPSRGKVVLSKKERKELGKFNKQHELANSSNLYNTDNIEVPSGSLSAQCSPYKGRVTELKNCIAKINSRGLFSSLNRGSQKSLNVNSQQHSELTQSSSSEISPPAPAPESSDAIISTELSGNNNDANYTEKIKNLPVRQRKTLISHMDNYCLFDPVDFINEKAYRNQTALSTDATVPTHGLRDPLFSSRQNLSFDEDMVPEVIYTEQNEAHRLDDMVEACNDSLAGAVASANLSKVNFDHHNYFVIDPDDFEGEPAADIGIPNPLSNEQFLNVKLEQAKEQPIPVSASFDKLTDASETTSSLSNSQESKDIATTASATTTTTSTALLESSTSTSSNNSSSGSASSSQTTLQRTKKKLTFLNLSPFRGQSSKRRCENDLAENTDKDSRICSKDNKTNARAVSEILTADHMIHLQNMLLDNKNNFRSHTVPIESNYVLFNPGPVPSRNVQYKIRKPRPLSTHSDADSGFLSPCSPDEFTALKFNPAILVLQQCDSVQGYIEVPIMLGRCVSYQGSKDNVNAIMNHDYAKIYTDWANYYLERAKSKKKVTDLSADCRDGLLLADVIEAVTSFKVPDLVKKPKNQQQMYDNVNSCLNLLKSHTVGGLENITTNDICAGRLKAVLALFFALSQQQLKQKNDLHQHAPQPTTAKSTTPNANGVLEETQQQPVENGNETMMNRQISTAYAKSNGGIAIPLPATVMVQRRCPPDKVRPLPPTPNHTPTIPGLGKGVTDISTSRPNSPPTSNITIQNNKASNNNGLRLQSAKTAQTYSGIPPPSVGPVSNSSTTSPQKHSMLDKLKLFNREKQHQPALPGVSVKGNRNQTHSKRTSSSSGFSSARSERSDSSLSLNDGNLSQIKPPAVNVSGEGKVRDSKISTKQSKLLAAQMKKEQAKAAKLDKKEKSPARSLNKEDASGSTDGRTSTMSRSKNSLPRLTEKNSSKTSSKSSLNCKSESKSSLILAPTKTLHSPNGTGLKPIAAIKGTSKLPQPPPILGADNRGRQISQSGSNNELKSDKSGISRTALTHISIEQKGLQQESLKPTTIQKSSNMQHHIVKPVPILSEMASRSPFYANTANISKLGVAPSNHIMLSESSLHSSQQTVHHNDPTYISTNNMRLLPPKASGVTTRKLEYNPAAANWLQSTQRTPINSVAYQPLAHIQSLSQPGTPVSSPSKFHALPNKISDVGGTIFEEERPLNVLPMRPLLHGYNSHVTLPTRGIRKASVHCVASEFADADSAQCGYCSDGDSLRTRNVQGRIGNVHTLGAGATSSRFYDTDTDGYLSEGSGGIGQHSSSLGGASHGKHFLSMMRARTQLPTTIEERVRNSRGSLDSIGTAPPSSITSQASSVCSNNKMNGNPNPGGGNGSGNGSANASPHHQHQHRSSTRNERSNWSSKPAELLNGQKSDKVEKSSPSHSRRSIGTSNNGSPSKQGSPSSRTKGVPPSFGYVKRTNGSVTATAEQQNIVMIAHNGAGGIVTNSSTQNSVQCGRTAHVSAVPRTTASGRKISGGTQTLPPEHISRFPPNTQHRSFSLTGPGATQLSQSIRERLAGSHSLPKPGTDLHLFQQRISNRPGKMVDGSLSDTQTYAEVKPEYSTYAIWLKHSNTAGSRLSEGDTLENMQIGSSAIHGRHGHKMLQHRNATIAAGLTHGGGVELPYVQSPRLNRSNSISYMKERTYPRSTKSEKMYPSMLNRGAEVECEPYYCLPVGTIASQNSIITTQMTAAAAAHNTGQNGVNSASSVAWSQPTSPTPLSRGFNSTLSPTHNNTIAMTGLANVPPGHRLTYPKKNDEVHGSAASLLSGGSSLYGSAEERQANEIRRLKRELIDAREQVLSLSSQLSTNAHVVAAFEQSLANMTSRLQQLTATAERKDGELTDMRQTIELLRKQSIQAGLTTAHMQSMGVQTQNQTDLLGKPTQISAIASQQQQKQFAHSGSHNKHSANGNSPSNGNMQRHHSSDSMCSLNSISSGCSAQEKKQKKKGWLRSSFTKAFSRNAKISKTCRPGHQQSHHHQGHTPVHGQKEDPTSKLNGQNSHTQNIVGIASLTKQPTNQLQNANIVVISNSPTKGTPTKSVTLIENAKPIDAIDHDEHHVVEDLKKQLREKDLVLTDIRLEALSSASQLENLKETVNKMRAEMMSLKQNNERLQKLVTTRSLAGSESSIGSNVISPSGSIGEARRYSLADSATRPPMELPKRLEEEVEEENIPPAPAPEPPPLSPTTHIDLTPPPPALESLSSPTHIPSVVEELPDMTDGKKISIACYLGQPESFTKYYEEMLQVDDFYSNGAVANGSALAVDGSDHPKSFSAPSPNEFVIANTYISGKTTWQNLDYIVRKTFKDYLSSIDPGTNLGLNTDSITSYHLGEAKRGPEMGFPELLPCGYIIGNVRTLYICLQGVGSLAFDSLIPRSIVHRYISLMTEHRRLILCGPSGTGKSYLARRLAEFLVARSGRGNPSEAIATFNVDHKSSKELRQYLSHIAEQASIANGVSELPSVIILDNLHHASALGDVFSCLLSAGPAAKLPCIIGTMSQATCNTTNLQLHHNFRWVLTANHMEPVKGFLGRFLRRRLFQLELQSHHSQTELGAVLAWLPTVWQHINRFLETHSSSDVTIGPRLFLSCPLDLKDSQVWFTDIWNYQLSPYLIEAVREGVQLYGRRGGAWNDPSLFIRNSYPWPYGPESVPPLRQINAEDVGLEGVAASSSENQDPLLNMLIRLQEAANYSESHDQESDCASLDSNVTPDSSAGAE